MGSEFLPKKSSKGTKKSSKLFASPEPFIKPPPISKEEFLGEIPPADYALPRFTTQRKQPAVKINSSETQSESLQNKLVNKKDLPTEIPPADYALPGFSNKEQLSAVKPSSSEIQSKSLYSKSVDKKELPTEISPELITEAILKDLSRLEGKYRETFRIGKYGAMPKTRDNKELLQYLRSHTREGFLKGRFIDLFGWQPFRGSELNGPPDKDEKGKSIPNAPYGTLAGEPIDFGHFFGSLAGQFGGVGITGMGASILYDLGAGVSWSGDLGTVVISIVDGKQDPNTAMDEFASDKDLSADIAAVTVGNSLSGSGTGKQEITNAVRNYDTADGGFIKHVRNFVKSELSGEFKQLNQDMLLLKNRDAVGNKIIETIFNFLNKDWSRNDQNSEKNRNNPNFPKDREILEKDAVNIVSNMFIEYLREKGNFYL